MRCQKVRSYLSAYCNQELTGSAMRKVSDHLTTCDSCRAEELGYRDLAQNAKVLTGFKVSEGFNNRLLDRIAHERFSETRTKAYLPKAAPSIWIRKVVPVLVTACLAFAIVFTNFDFGNDSQPQQLATTTGPLNNDYMTAQPVDNPNLISMMDKGWSLDEQMARSQRYNRISKQMTPDLPFDYYGHPANAVNVANRSIMPTPFVSNYYRIRPVIVIFEPAKPTPVKEAEVKY